MQKNWGEAASLHLVILFPIEMTHSSWFFLGGGGDWMKPWLTSMHKPQTVCSVADQRAQTTDSV